MTTFWVLFVVTWFAHSQAMAVDHFDTKQQCEAAAQALIVNTREWSWGRVKENEAFCFEARP